MIIDLGGRRLFGIESKAVQRAYKDIGEVMANQADLVTIDHTLHQVLNYKGT